MKKSIIDITGRIEKQFSQIGAIVDLLEKKNTLSLSKTLGWLVETEELLQKLRITESSKFSVKRGELSTFYPKDTRNKKREQLQFCSSVLTQAQDDLWKVYEVYIEKVENARTLVKQLLGVIYQTKQFKFDPSENFTLFLGEMWKFCTQHEQLKGVSLQILSLINKGDVLIVMAEEIEIGSL